jgi:hypothetical protein
MSLRQARCAIMPVVKAAGRRVVVVLVVALGGAPTLLDGCLIACQTPPLGSSRPQSGDEQGCHEAATDPGSRSGLWDRAKHCGHDHGETGAQLAAATDGSSPIKALHAPIALVTSVALRRGRSSACPTLARVIAPGAVTGSAFVLPLRI